MNCSVMSILPFVCGGIKVLELDIQDLHSSEAIENLFASLSNRVTSLTRLYLFLDESVDKVEQVLSSWLARCGSLIEVQLPPYYHATSIVTTLGSLPHLTDIGEILDEDAEPNNDGMRFQLRDDAFPSLDGLEISQPLQLVTELLKTSARWSQLRLLRINDSSPERHASLKRFTSALALACPEILYVYINSSKPKTKEAVKAELSRSIVFVLCSRAEISPPYTSGRTCLWCSQSRM